MGIKGQVCSAQAGLLLLFYLPCETHGEGAEKEYEDPETEKGEDYEVADTAAGRVLFDGREQSGLGHHVQSVLSGAD